MSEILKNQRVCATFVIDGKKKLKVVDIINVTLPVTYEEGPEVCGSKEAALKILRTQIRTLALNKARIAKTAGGSFKAAKELAVARIFDDPTLYAELAQVRQSVAPNGKEAVAEAVSTYINALAVKIQGESSADATSLPDASEDDVEEEATA